ncbi:MAG: 5-formyltetrahydrofolate cyclo-ligase [Polyangiaceae bacterium]
MPDHHGFIPSSSEDLLRRRVKAELRKRMRALRGALPASACAEKSERIVQRVLSLQSIAGASAIALFWPMENRHEVDLRPLDALLRERGARIAYPAIELPSQVIVFRFVPAVSALTMNPLGFYEPPPEGGDIEPGSLDAIVVPALAVDPRGHRIGYGAGHYDRTLPCFLPRATTVAVAFDFQLVAEVPETHGDVAVRWVVTEARTLDSEREPGVSESAR